MSPQTNSPAPLPRLPSLMSMPTAPAPHPRRQLRNYLLDRSFQIRYTLAVVLLASAISAGLGTFLYRAQRENSRITLLHDPEMGGLLEPELQSEDRKILIGMGIFLGTLVVGLGALGIFATHRIAGPAHVISSLAEAVGQGHLPSARPLRHGDELQAAARAMGQMLEQLRAREAKELAGLENLRAELARHPDVPAKLSEWLDQTIRVKRARLGEEEP
jgi:hypothetical protein